ncbi:MAG TPA: PQQ-binding-like beta-propeller repeat protein [Gammaproteobacteria bacterium]|nr:PQQ-binding-like beta-propeller repeat protein [Gammaproteobacteria bacterium]
MRIVYGVVAAAVTLAIAGCGPSSPGPQSSAAAPQSEPKAAPAQSVAPGDWPLINRDLNANRYSPLAEINASNVANLQASWSYQLGGNSTAVPIVIAGVMYVPSRDRVVALDADTGTEVWAYVLPAPPAPATPPAPPAQPAGAAPAGGGGARGGGARGGGGPRGPAGPTASTRGVSYWAGDGTLGPRILFMSGANLVAIDAATGKAAAGFGTDGLVNIGVPYGGTPTVFKNVAIVGAASGEVPQGPAGNPRAFDVRTGAKLWEFQTVPQAGQPFNDTWGGGAEGRAGTNMWGFAAPIDAERGIAYLPIAGPAANYYGGDRPGVNAFGNSIVAVDALTGKYLWHFQTVHHDIWDTDMPSAGALFDFVKDGQRFPAIGQVGKSSFFYVLNRETGKPLIDVEEKPVPKGDVPTEWYSPTQPIPVRPPPLARVSFSPADLVTAEDTTAEHAAACREFMEKSGGFYNAGPFTPFLYHAPNAAPKSTIQFPGGTGGVNWGGVAANPTNGMFYAASHDGALVGWVQDKDPNQTYSFEAVGSKQPYDRASINGVGPFFSFNAPLSGKYDDRGRPVGPSAPCQRPPWGKLVAVNANTGEIAWESVLGLNESLPEGKQLVGSAGSAGPTVTAGGLVFVGSTSDRRFRAFDASNGKELWTAQLDNNGNANPMSYAGKSGKQRVAIIAGDRVMTYALP